MADPVQEVAGRLYGLPLEDFTRERDAAARELRKAKDRDAAATVAKLPKPSQAAWAANTLARERRELVDALLEAGAALRAAQLAAVEGKGAEALREAAANERAAVDQLVAAARELRPGGRRASAATLERLRTTLHSAAVDEGVRAALDDGRLVEDVEGGGAWGLVPGMELAAPREPRAKSGRTAAGKGAGERGAAKGRGAGTARGEEAAEREDALKAVREARARLEASLREARAERRSRERELERAEKAAARASDRHRAALDAAEEAREQADEANAELEAASEAASEARDTVARLEEQLD